MAQLSGAGFALLVRANAVRAVDGHRHVAARAQPDDDGARPAGRAVADGSPDDAPYRRGRGSGEMRMNARVVALGAGVFFVSLAVFVQGVLPFLHAESRTTRSEDHTSELQSLMRTPYA